MLTPSSIHAPAYVLSACGFESRSAAQDAFFSKAKLLYDFASDEDPLSKLQGSIILCMIILDRPTDRDFGYWLHNAIRLATKLDEPDLAFADKLIREAVRDISVAAPEFCHPLVLTGNSIEDTRRQ